MATQTARRTSRTQKAAAPDSGLARIIDPGWSWDDKLPLAQAKQIGNTIYVSGQVAFNAQGKLVGKGQYEGPDPPGISEY